MRMHAYKAGVLSTTQIRIESGFRVSTVPVSVGQGGDSGPAVKRRRCQLRYRRQELLFGLGSQKGANLLSLLVVVDALQSRQKRVRRLALPPALSLVQSLRSAPVRSPVSLSAYHGRGRPQ